MQYFSVFNHPGLTSGPGCITTRLKIKCSVIYIYSSTCVRLFNQGSVSLVPKKKDAFITVGEAAGEKSGGFPTHTRSEVGCKLSRSCLHVTISFTKLLTFPCSQTTAISASQIASGETCVAYASN